MSDLFSNTDVKKCSRKNEYKMNCPLCQIRVGKVDTKYKFSFNLVTRKYNCYRCGARPSNTGPLENILHDVDTFETSVTDVSEIRNRLNNAFNPKEVQPINLDLLSWPLSSRDTPIAYDYLRTRGFNDQELEKYKIRVGKEFTDNGKKVRKYKGRVIFPFFENGKPIYLVGRAYNGCGGPRYVNSKGKKELVVYGIDNIQDNKECIICEGIISAISAERTTGIPAVSFLGKSGTVWQLSKLRSKCNRVYLSLDGGVGSGGTGNLRVHLTQMGFEVFEVSLPDGYDPDDLKDEYLYYFTKAKKIFASSAVVR